jgi:very-short-patch-repair endonuclease
MKTPKELSEGEETLALHLRANNIDFEREVALIPGRKWRVDFLIGKLVVEVHGAIWKKGAHSSGTGLERDYRKMNALILAGYAVLQYSTAQVIKCDAIRDIMQVTGGKN